MPVFIFTQLLWNCLLNVVELKSMSKEQQQKINLDTIIGFSFVSAYFRWAVIIDF